jgi:XapX domain-containing protein
MIRFCLGLALSFLIGAGCAYLKIPVPGPDRVRGALLVVALTLGYVLASRFLK